MKTAQEWFDAYGVSHQNKTNKAIHWVCVPVIFFTTIGLFMSIPAGPLELLPDSLDVYRNWAAVLLLVGMAFYATMGATIFLGMLGIAAVTFWGNAELASCLEMPLWQFSAIGFAVAWVGQFIGHEIEGVKPSFFEDLQFLLVGPAWLLHFIYRKLGIPYCGRTA